MQLRRPLETLQLPQCYLSSAGSILRHLQMIAITSKCSSQTLKPLGSFTRFFRVTFGVNGHVVHIDCQPLLSDVIGEY
jgi:hypothetical protein